MAEESLNLRLGTRKSALALAQSGQMARALEDLHPGLTVELVPIVTRGDREKGELAKIGGKGLFTEELESGLLDGTFDLAVHSLKDLPVRLPDGLTLAAFPARADARDMLISEVGDHLDDLPTAATLLTGSLRRGAQIRHRRPDLLIEPIRGNIDTRLRKWRQSGHAGVILAAAGIHRLAREKVELQQVPAHEMDPEIMIPAPGQGILALEVKQGSRAEPICRAMNHPPSARAAAAERRVVTAFGGDCTLPLAAWARPSEGEGLLLTCMLALPDGSRLVRATASGDDPRAIAEACVEQMRREGADEVLRALRK